MTTANTKRESSVQLQRFPDLYLRLDTAKGRGVFSRTPIPAGTIIDTSPVLVLDPQDNKDHIEHTSLYHYTYNWPISSSHLDRNSSNTVEDSKRPTTTQAVVLGLGSMFNHSRHAQNVGWTRDVERSVIVYRALRDIDAGEELCISYGDHLTFVDADSVGMVGISDGTPETVDEALSGIDL